MRLTEGVTTIQVPVNWWFTEHQHDGVEIVGVLEGDVYLHAAHEEWLVATGQVVVVPPFLLHGWSSTGGAQLNVAHLLHVNRDIVTRLLPRNHPRLLELGKEQFAEYRLLFERVEAIVRQTAHAYSPLLHAYREVFLLNLLDGPHEQDAVQSLLHEVTLYMRAHLSESLSVAQLAQSFLVSEVTLRRHFQRVLGISPKQYLLNLRLQEAQRLLMASQLSIQEIAQQAGFYDLAHFSTTFRKRFGQSPSEWRKAGQG